MKRRKQARRRRKVMLDSAYRRPTARHTAVPHADFPKIVTLPETPCGDSILTGPAENQQSKSLGNDGRPWMGILLCSRRRRSKLGRYRVNIVVSGVERHGARPALRRYGLDHAVFVRRVIVRYRDGAIPTGRECQVGRW